MAAGVPLAAIQGAVPAPEPERPHLWPENARPVEVFVALRTQWRMGPEGPVGLDYAALQAEPLWRALPPRERARVRAGVQVLEDEALRLMAARAAAHS